jgi:hypothetical protein
MMKKLLVLMLVVAMGGLTSAGLICEVDGPDTFSISIDEAVSGYEFTVKVLGLEGDDLALASAAGFGFTWEFDNMVDVDTGTEWRGFGSQLFGAPQGPGKIVTLNYTGQGWVEISDAYNPSFGTVTVYVPEPMSLMLLGLGGLFLRRRK